MNSPCSLLIQIHWHLKNQHMHPHELFRNSISKLPHLQDQAVARRKRGEVTSEQWSSKQGKSNLGPAGKKAKLDKSSGPQLNQEVIDLASSEDDAVQK